MLCKSYAALDAKSELRPLSIERKSPGPDEVLIKIAYCGICHSDIHTARSEWGPALYPCVPGHEIVGHVAEVGQAVKRFKVGDTVGVGCMVDSCGTCANCKEHEEQYCSKQTVFTYNSPYKDGHTFGGYSTHITVKETFVLKVSNKQNLAGVAPLLCAGITTYSPLVRFGTGPGKKVGVVGLGGLGHMAVKIAAAMGAEVTVFSRSQDKEQEAKKLGATHFVNTRNPENFSAVAGKLDLTIDTVAAPHNFTPYLNCLKKGGQHVLVGVAPEANELEAFGLISGRKMLVGSLIGGIKETQEMLDFCEKHNILAEIELISAEKINEAYERTIRSDVHYRFVIDAATI